MPTLMVLHYSKFQEFLFNTLQSRNVSVKSASPKVDQTFEKNALKVSYMMD